MSTRIYRSFDPNIGYPVGKNLYYECLRCGDVLPSEPEDGTRCTCRNILIDVDAGRISIEDHALVKLFAVSV